MAAVVASLTLAACGSSDDDTTSAAGGSTPAATTGGSTTTASGGDASRDAAVAEALKYTGSTEGAADASKDPIGVGWANDDEGKAPAPQITAAVKAAFDFVNKDLGGVDGRPLKLIADRQCVLGAAEKQGTSCAQALLNNPAVDVIMVGYTPVGGRSLLATVRDNGRVPVIGAIPLSPEDMAAKSSFFTSGGPFTVATVATFMKDVLKAKTAAEIWPDDPAQTPFIEGFEKSLESLGIKVTSAYVPPDATDALAPVTAARPNEQDVVNVNPFTPGQCIADAKALKTLGVDKPTIAVGSLCLDPSVKAELGDYPKFILNFSYPVPDIPAPQTDAMNWALGQYSSDADKVAHGFYAPQYFGLALTLQKWLGELGADKDIDVKTLGPVITSFTGPIWGGAPTLKFGSPGTPAVGSFAARFAEYLGDGKWKYVSGWLNPPPPAS